MPYLTTDKEKEYKPTLLQCPRCTASGFAIHDDETHWKCLICGHSTHAFKDPDIGPDQLKDTNGITEDIK
jgi:rubrerythrin